MNCISSATVNSKRSLLGATGRLHQGNRARAVGVYGPDTPTTAPLSTGRHLAVPPGFTTAFASRSRFSTRGMTLVEVSLALAIGAFALMVLLGVVGGSLAGGRHASDESTAGLIQQRLLCDLRGQLFTNITLSDATTVKVDLSTTTSNTVDYNASGEPSSPAYLRATLWTQPTNLTSLTAPYNLAVVKIQVVWPLTSTTKNTNEFNTWIFRRQ